MRFGGTSVGLAGPVVLHPGEVLHLAEQVLYGDIMAERTLIVEPIEIPQHGMAMPVEAYVQPGPLVTGYGDVLVHPRTM